MNNTNTDRDALEKKIANKVNRMFRDTNPYSPHGKQFKAAAGGFCINSINPNTTIDDLKKLDTALDAAMELWGRPDEVIAAATLLKEINIAPLTR